MSGSSLKFYLKGFFLNVSGELVDWFLPKMYRHQGGEKDHGLANVLFWTS